MSVKSSTSFERTLTKLQPDQIPYHSLFDTLIAQLVQKGERVVDDEYLDLRPEQKATYTELALDLNLLKEHLNIQTFKSEWHNGVSEYFDKIEPYIKTLPNFEELKNTCLIYRLMKLEENINWEYVDLNEDKDVKIDPELRKEVRDMWREEWRNRCLNKLNLLLLSMILIQAVNSYKFFINCGFDDFSDAIDSSVIKLKSTAGQIEKVTKKTGIAKIVAGGGGIIAAGTGLGVLLAPITGGASLAIALTATSMTAGLAAGATNLGSTIVKNKGVKKAVDECQLETGEAINQSLILKELINDTATTFQQINDLLEEFNSVYKGDLRKLLEDKRMDIALQSGGTAWKLVAGIGSLAEFNLAMFLLNGVKAGVLEPLTKVGTSAMNAVGISFTSAGSGVASGLNIGAIAGPLVGGVIAGFTVFCSVKDILAGAKDCKGAELGDDLRSLAEHLPMIRDNLRENIMKFRGMNKFAEQDSSYLEDQNLMNSFDGLLI